VSAPGVQEPEAWRLSGVAVVTGAARGIGAAIAVRLAGRGATVVAADVLAEEIEASVSSWRSYGLDITGHVVDVSEQDSVENLAEHAASMGPLTAWVNNAGIIDRSPLLDIEASAFDRLMAVNARGCLFGTQSAARRMGRGTSIVNLASMSSSIAIRNSAHYGATKAAIAVLTKNAALELAPLGIRVNAVAPGSIRTAFTEERLADPEALQQTEERIPLGRVGVPDDIAGPVVFLCSNESAYMTGAIVAVDGGWTAW
jgi:NAD(P)-dependent dehydrogenase (short-subunit alcohol dehydrogenase family)